MSDFRSAAFQHVCCCQRILPVLFDVSFQDCFRSTDPFFVASARLGRRQDVYVSFIFGAAPVAFPTSGSRPGTATVAFTTFPTLATDEPLLAVVRTFSVLVVVASSILVVSSTVKAFLLPTQDVASVSTRSGCKRSRDDEHSWSVERFRSGKEILCTHFEILLLYEFGAPLFQGIARGRHETNTFNGPPPGASAVSTPRIEVSLYMSRFQSWLDGRHFVSIALNGACPHVMIRNSRRNTTVGTRARLTTICNWRS